ncbi:FG-GAP repeat protein [Herbidospora cretacea]|uniref:FG-GAP repeat protein n=1 Tax=Herbidospora cretacea TaxID=28444 RepID=UPI0004C3FFDB|nr:FG-GAP repeat protein [Herbidospora cretacea]
MTRLLAALLFGAALLPSGTATAAPCADTAHAVGDPFAETVTFGGRTLKAPGGETDTGFGWSVATAHVDGDRCLDVVVGAPYAGADDEGAVYVFGAGGVRTLTAQDPEKDAHFGWSLAAADLPAGWLLAVGEPHADDPLTDAGAVHLLSPKGRVRLNQESDGVIGNGEVGDMWGWSLAFHGDPARPDLAVGVPYEDNDGTGVQVASGIVDAGTVVVIRDVLAGAPYTTRKWDLGQATKDVPEEKNNRFGWTLAATRSGGVSYLAAGAPLAGPRDAGMVQLWADLSPVRAITVPGTTGLGWALAFTGDGRLAMGHPYTKGATGGVHTSTVGGTVAALPVPPQPGQRYGWSLAADGATGLLVGAPDRDGVGAVSTSAATSGPAGSVDYGHAVS